MEHKEHSRQSLTAHPFDRLSETKAENMNTQREKIKYKTPKECSTKLLGRNKPQTPYRAYEQKKRASQSLKEKERQGKKNKEERTVQSIFFFLASSTRKNICKLRKYT